MKTFTRRSFFSNTIGAATALSLPLTAASQPANPLKTRDGIPEITDTNIHLFDWPFRKLKYGNTRTLLDKLRKHRVTQAWAGSYESLFHKDINGVNARLAEECRANGNGMLHPFGTVNLAWPDWEEDLRRCHEVHKMKGIRIYPIYQTFDLDHPDFARLVELTSKRRMLLQIVGDMEDSRHHHPIVQVRSANFSLLVDMMTRFPDAIIQLLYWNHKVSRDLLPKLIRDTRVVFDTSRVEGAGEVGRLIEGRSWSGNNEALPPDRVLFGSHAPYFPIEANILKLFESPLTADQMRAIMNGNAQRLIPTT